MEQVRCSTNRKAERERLSSKIVCSCTEETHRCNSQKNVCVEVMDISRGRGRPKRPGEKQLEMTLRHLI